MAGVNLLKQIRTDEVVEQTAIISGGSGFLSEIGSLDKIRFGLFVAGLAGFFLIRGYVNDTYLPAKLVAPQAELATINQKIATTNAKRSQLADLEKELKENETKIEALKQKIVVINRIKNSNRDKVVRTVDYIVNQLPDTIWISELKVDAKPGNEINLKGYSMEHQNISGFFTKLESGVFFTKWQLVDSTREKIKRGENKEFEASRFELKAQSSEAQ